MVGPAERGSRWLRRTGCSLDLDGLELLVAFCSSCRIRRFIGLLMDGLAQDSFGELFSFDFGRVGGLGDS